MLKRAAAWLLALTLCMGIGTVGAEETPKADADLVDLFSSDNGELTWVGTAIPVWEGTLLAAGIVTDEAETMLTVADGVDLIDAYAWTDAQDLITLVLYDEGEHPLALDYYDLAPADRLENGNYLSVRCGDQAGSRINRSITAWSTQTWQNREVRLATLNGPVELGAAVLTEGNELAGIVVAAWAEGENRYIVIPSTTIADMLAEASDALNGPREMEPPEGFEVTLEGNFATFDWSGMTLELAEGESAFLVIMDADNNFFTYYRLQSTKPPVQMLLVPGHTYFSGISVSKTSPDGNLDRYVVTEVPEAEPLTDYNFTSKVCSLAVAPPEGLADGAAPIPVPQPSKEELQAGRVYFYSSSSYEVPDVIDDLSLLVTMTSPDGNTHSYASGWVYDPAYQAEDTWYVSLEDMGFLQAMSQTAFLPGEYTMAFYIEGKLADSLTFEIPQGGE